MSNEYDYYRVVTDPIEILYRSPAGRVSLERYDKRTREWVSYVASEGDLDHLEKVDAARAERFMAGNGQLAPITKHLKYWDYDREATLTCPACGWTGRGADHADYFDELLDVTCPTCGRMLLVVTFPTPEETRAAAASGNPRAQAELPNLDAREAFLRRARELELEDPKQLPRLDGDRLVIDWDFEERDDERWTVLRKEGHEIWRELAYWEGYERFAAVFEILRERYGSRLAEVRPTSASKLYLYGDKLSAPATIEKLNASLKRP